MLEFYVCRFLVDFLVFVLYLLFYTCWFLPFVLYELFYTNHLLYTSFIPFVLCPLFYNSCFISLALSNDFTVIYSFDTFRHRFVQASFSNIFPLLNILFVGRSYYGVHFLSIHAGIHSSPVHEKDRMLYSRRGFKREKLRINRKFMGVTVYSLIVFFLYEAHRTQRYFLRSSIPLFWRRIFFTWQP